MPTKPIDRLLFAQGGLCFFCNVELPKAEASIEHLVASARGGLNGDDNCVACCTSMNALLGSMSLKEKIKVVLNQKGQFRCPNGNSVSPSLPNVPTPPKQPAKKPPVTKAEDPLAALIKNLKSRSKGRPTKLKALAADIRSQKLGLSEAQISDLIEKLQAQGKIVVTDTQITYKL